MDSLSDVAVKAQQPALRCRGNLRLINPDVSHSQTPTKRGIKPRQIGYLTPVNPAQAHSFDIPRKPSGIGFSACASLLPLQWVYLCGASCL